MRATRTVGMLFLLLCCMGSILAQQPFTYQGMLKTSGIPANGNYDFQFSLWTASSGGSQVGSTVTRIGVSVGNGLFTTELDFGSVWDGNERYLQIAVRPSGSGSYTTLSPRVKVNRAPYSQLAFGALSVPWSGIVGMPAGFADGVDNDTTYTAGAGLQLVGNTFSIASGGVVSAMLADGSVVTGKIANGAVTTDKLADGAVTTAKIGDGQVTDAKIASVSWSKVTGAPSSFPPGGSAGGDLSGSYPNPTVAKIQGRAVASTAPSAGQVLKWNGSAWSPDTDLRDAFWQASGSDIFYSAGKVGIGTNSPETRLHVLAGSAGTVTADANSVLTIEHNDRAYLSILTPDTTERGILFGQPSSNVAGGILYNSSATLNGFQFRTNGNLTRMVIDGSGNVGIGLTAPTARLHIRNGDLRVDSGEIQSWGAITLHPDVDNSGDDIVAFVNSAGTEVMRVHSNGNVGIGTSGPGYPLHVETGTGFRAIYGVNTATSGTTYGMVGQSASVDGRGVFGYATATSGTTYGVYGESASAWGRGVFGYATATSGTTYGVYGRSDSPDGYGGYFVGRGYFSGNVGVGGAPVSDAKLLVNGTARVGVLEITGADFAEKFPTTDNLEPGMVVEIDPDHPGHLRKARGAYNKRVAGVVAGANGLSKGIVLGNLEGSESHTPIAMSGRVWVYADATEHAIEPGDLLTTSNKPGYAMAAHDPHQSHGAILGKAMTRLEKGETGFVLMLVNLH